MNINDWIRGGKEVRKFGTRMRPVVETAPGNWEQVRTCDTVAEKMADPEDLAEWLLLSPGCRAQHEATAGMKYSPSVGAFLGAGAEAPDAVNLVPVFRPKSGPTPVDSPSLTDKAKKGDPRSELIAPRSIIPKQEKTKMAGRSVMALAPTAAKDSWLGAIGGAIGGFIGGGPAGAIAGGLAGWQGGGTGGRESYTSPGTGGRSTGYTTPATFAGGAACPQGHVFRNGRCEQTGIGGAVARWIPGGSPGVAQQMSGGPSSGGCSMVPWSDYGGAVMGAYGTAALVPAEAPILTRRCPPGNVLGKDGLCYPSNTKGLQRMWPKPPRPLLTGGEAKILAKATALEKRIHGRINRKGGTHRVIKRK